MAGFPAGTIIKVGLLQALQEIPNDDLSEDLNRPFLMGSKGDEFRKPTLAELYEFKLR